MNQKFDEYTSIKKEENNMYANNIKFKDININNILELTPRDILNCLLYNKNSISTEVKKLQYQILQLTKEVNITSKYSKKNKLQKEIEDRKEVIDEINKSLNKWALNKYKEIKNIIRETLEQSSSLSEEELTSMVTKIEKMLTYKKYMSTPVKKIIYIMLKQKEIEKENSYVESNFPVQIQQELIKTEEKNIYKQPDYEVDNVCETIIPTEILNKLSRNSSNNNSNNNVKVSMFYASIDGGIDGNILGNESFQVILLKFLDLMSKFLYGTLQNQITELYKEIDKNNSNKRYY